jgi:signal transduction histidine kinase
VKVQKSDKILIVDDDPAIGKTLKDFLDFQGYISSMVSSGSDALDMLEKDKSFTLVLLDIKMPGISGVTVLKHLKNRCSDVAVIMMSGHGSEALAVECMKDGAEDYISKPFSFEDLRQRVERTLAHRWERIEKRRLQQEKEDFILMLSHDMKNPLTAVIGSIDIIREGCLGAVNEEQGEYLQSAIDSCNEVVLMIDNLLDIKKFEAGKMQMNIRPHNIHELISKVSKQFARPARHEGMEFSADLKPFKAEIEVDKNSFIRVLGNLLGNALKFTPEGGKISISCCSITGNDILDIKIPDYVQVAPDFLKCDHFVKVIVSDTGNGIPANELECIFDRYTQFTRKTGRELGGAGMGLAYCKLAIESFHGIIWAECKTGQGSEFVILLPAVKSTEAEATAPVEV